MKSLSLAKPLVLVTVGLPGAGKSFFAWQFSDTFSAPVVSYDRLRHILFGHAGFTKDEQAKVSELALYQAEELLKTQKTFIVDGGSASRLERATLSKLARQTGYETLLVWVQTDPTTAQFRSMKRSKKRTDDQYNPSLSVEEYTQSARRFSAPMANEDVVVVSGKHTYATQARIVLKKLVAGRDAPLNPRAIIGHDTRPTNVRGDENPERRNVLVR